MISNKSLIVFFAISLFVSGITAFFVPWGMELILSSGAFQNTSLGTWLSYVDTGVQHNDKHFQFFFYGTDWLAFAHVLFAILFYGVRNHLKRNVWVIEFGLIACILILPLAMIMGEIRGIPWAWRLMDSSFGIIGGAVLYVVYKRLRKSLTHRQSRQGISGIYAHTL